MNDTIDETLVRDAAEIVVATQFGSTSLLQRRLGVSFTSAMRLVNHLAERGIVASDVASGSLVRDVLVPRSEIHTLEHRLAPKPSPMEAAQAALARVEALHVRDSVFRDHCAECSDFGTDEFPPGARVEWPCATIRAIAEREAVEGA